MIFNTLAVSCVLELLEVNSITKKCALVLCESPEFYRQIVFQDNIPMIKKKSIKYPLFVFFFFLENHYLLDQIKLLSHFCMVTVCILSEA